jgi:ketosteroid isomerase-like protein
VHPNESLVRDGYEAFLRGDLAAVAGFIAPDAQWHVAGDSPLAGVYKGHEELFAFFARLYEMTDGTVAITARDILASDDHTIVLTTLKARRGDEYLEDDGVAVFKIEDGKAHEIWVFAEDQAKMDAFFS